MKRTVFVFVISALVICLIIGVLFFTRSKKDPNVLFLYGNVDVRQVDIGFRVSGLINALHFEEGDLVSQGTLMTTLDKTPYDNEVLKAAAAVESIKANFNNAEILLQRRRELINVGGVSQEDLDNALSAYKQLEASLQAAEAQLAVARDNLNYTEAFAPTDGIILTRIREPGTVVNPADPVYTLSVISPVWVRAYINEVHLGQIYYGMEAAIYTDTEGGPSYCGKIGFISPVAEFTPKTVETTQLRTDLVYRLRIYVENPDRYLKQGMPVTVKLHIDQKKRRASE